MTEVVIVAGSESDKEIVEMATSVLRKEGIRYRVEYASAHREPDRVREIAQDPEAKVFIAVAGLSAALPGVLASHTRRPVIGVPVSSKLGGLDALLSTAQMPKGVPVAAVGVDNGHNAAHLAKRMLDLVV